MNFISLLVLRSIVKWRLFWEEREVRKRYYRDRNFRRIDRMLKKVYRFSNPYRICRKSGEIYGETYLTSLERIARECELEESDRILELGAGRGRSVFFLAALLGCEVRGVEMVPDFVKKAQRVKERAGCDRVSFVEGDMAECDLSQVNAIYLYGTCLSDPMIGKMIDRFKELPQRSKILTVSYSLLEYPGSSYLRLKKSFIVPFPWGEGEIFYHERK